MALLLVADNNSAAVPPSSLSMQHLTQHLLRKMIVWLTLLALTLTRVYAQKISPLLRASSKSVSIRDGNALKKEVWTLDPTLKLDTYFIDFPQANSRVSFISDQDSLSFDTRYGQVL